MRNLTRLLAACATLVAAGLGASNALADWASATSFYADADTHFYLNGQFRAMCKDLTQIDMTETTLHFYGAGHHHEIWAGSIADAGEDDNVCVGTILLEDGGTLDVVKVPQWPDGDYTQYVKTLTLSDGSTLNLDYPHLLPQPDDRPGRYHLRPEYADPCSRTRHTRAPGRGRLGPARPAQAETVTQTIRRRVAWPPDRTCLASSF